MRIHDDEKADGLVQVNRFQVVSKSALPGFSLVVNVLGCWYAVPGF